MWIGERIFIEQKKEGTLLEAAGFFRFVTREPDRATVCVADRNERGSLLCGSVFLLCWSHWCWQSVWQVVLRRRSLLAWRAMS